MQTIETTATVTPEGTLTVAVPPTIAPGPHRVVVVIEETITAGEPVAAREAITLRPLLLAGWPADATFGREEIYGDDGRCVVRRHEYLALRLHPRSPWHSPATTTLADVRKAGTTLVISPQVVREYVAVATRPGVLDPVPPLADLLANVANLLATCRVVDDTRTVSEPLVTLLAAVPAAQRRVHDANLVATMLTWGVQQLLTHNTQHFAPYAHLIVIVPLVPRPHHHSAKHGGRPVVLASCPLGVFVPGHKM